MDARDDLIRIIRDVMPHVSEAAANNAQVLADRRDRLDRRPPDSPHSIRVAGAVMGKVATAFKDIGKACSGALSAATFEIAFLVNT